MKLDGDDGKLIGTTLVIKRIGVVKATLYHWVELGKFPPPIRFGRLFRWRVREVELWIAARKKAVGDRIRQGSDPTEIAQMAIRTLDSGQGGRGKKKPRGPARPRGRPRRDQRGLSCDA